MKYTFQLTIINPETGEEQIETITSFDKPNDQLENIGITLEESKELLKTLQETIVRKQTEEHISECSHCSCCGKSFRKKENGNMIFRTLFGDVHLSNPRFYQCECSNELSKTFTPLRDLFMEKTSPERLYMETKWASLISFGQTVDLLKDVLPMSEKLNASSVRNNLQKVALRHEESLKSEPKVDFLECRKTQFENRFQRPKGTVYIGLDGGYVRSWENKKKNFEVIAGKSIPTEQEDKYFAFLDTEKTTEESQKILLETLRVQGVSPNQTLEFLSDGAINLRVLQQFLYPNSKHYLDWFHITMRITVLGQYIKGLKKKNKSDGEVYERYLEKIKWHLWHGNEHKVLWYMEMLDGVDEIESSYENLKSFKKHVNEFIDYIRNNLTLLTNYSDRYHHNEVFTSSFVESTVNHVVAKRFCKKQQMQWSKQGAHRLLLVRVKVLNEDLVDCFREWYPNFQINKKDYYSAA